MTETHLVTDEEAARLRWWPEVPTSKELDRLLATRAAFVSFLNEHTPSCGEHRDCGTRRWCYDCGEWCYESAPCLGCDGRALLAELHGTENG
jgi:hypothetical protein